MKNKELESRRPTLFLLGLIAALSLTLTAFEWRSETEQYVVPFDIDTYELIFEKDLQAVVVELEQRVAQSEERPAPSNQPSNRFEIVPDAMPVMDSGSEMGKLVLSRPEQARTRGIARDIQTLSSTVKSVRGLQPHEMPYMKLCGNIKDDIERFQCTQQELKKYVVSNFKIPSSHQMENLPKRIEVKFTINSYGSIIEVQADQDYHSSLLSEIERVMKNIPEMVPATVSGERINVRFELPIVLERF